MTAISTEELAGLAERLPSGPWTLIGMTIHDGALLRVASVFNSTSPGRTAANARLLALAPTLAAEVIELRAERAAVMRHVPMDYLQRHDAPGATGPTDALKLSAAMRDYAEDRWKLINRMKELRAQVEELDFLRHEGGPDSVAALEARVLELEAAQQWQPIETAPRDGTTIVARSNIPGHQGLSLIFWDAADGWCGVTVDHVKLVAKFPPAEWCAIARAALNQTGGAT